MAATSSQPASDLFPLPSSAVSGHKSVEWYTPKWIFDELRLSFDLDPSSPHDAATHVPTRHAYTVFDNGLTNPWFGRVWLNPPFGPDIGFWVRRLIEHGHGIALTFSRTDAAWCQEAMQAAHATLFLAGRVEFVPGHENRHKRSRSGAGTVLFAFGDDCADALDRLAGRGVFFRAAAATALPET